MKYARNEGKWEILRNTKANINDRYTKIIKNGYISILC